MAQRTVTLLTDDLDGTELKAGDGETIEFALDGGKYSIDLGSKNAKALRAALSPFVSAARKQGGRPTTRRRASHRPAGSAREQVAAIREWARSNGYEVADRGRIPATIVDAYHTAP